MKKAGKKKRVSEFATEYTLANAAKKGDIVTKLSFLIMGLGNTAMNTDVAADAEEATE